MAIFARNRASEPVKGRSRVNHRLAGWMDAMTVVIAAGLGASAAGVLRGARSERAGVQCGLSQTSRPIRSTRSVASVMAGVCSSLLSVIMRSHTWSTCCQAVRMTTR